MAAPDRLALLWGASFFTGSAAQPTARLTGPLVVVLLLLAVGLLAGEAGPGWIHPSRFGRGLEPLVGPLVCLALFDGGLNLRLMGRTLQHSLLRLGLGLGGGLLCVLALTRLVLQLAGLGAPLDRRAMLLLRWVSPRGIVTAAVASLFALRLEAAGVAGAGDLKGLVFAAILVIVGVQGASAPWLARRLGLSESPAAPSTAGMAAAAAVLAAAAAPASPPLPHRR